MIVTRPLRTEDAEALLDLCLTLDRETTFMMLEPGERAGGIEAQRERLECASRLHNDVLLGAFDGEVLVGYVEVTGGRFHRNAHSAVVAIGVRQSAAGTGVGSILMDTLHAWAVAHGVHRLELTVMAHNQRAIRLYQKAGYELEGLRRHSLLVDGAWIDELAMAKLLPIAERPGDPRSPVVRE